MLGSGSAPRTVPSPPTPELHKFHALSCFCLRLGDSSARKRAARRALGGWAVEGVHLIHLSPPLATAMLGLGSAKSQELRLHPPAPALQAGRAPDTRSHPGHPSELQNSFHLGTVHTRPPLPGKVRRGGEGGGSSCRAADLRGRGQGGWAPSPELAPGSCPVPDPGWRVTYCPSPGPL